MAERTYRVRIHIWDVGIRRWVHERVVLADSPAHAVAIVANDLRTSHKVQDATVEPIDE